jgi:4-hydroxy-tetrahydrodipicolinate synthase
MKIGGIIPPMVTPFDPSGRIDEQAHRAEVRYLLRAGVHGLAAGGSTGEGHTLSTEETRALVGWTVEEAGGRIPVIAGIITDSTQSAIGRARAVASLGVAALQVTPVHYLFRPDDDAMLRHFAAIAEASGVPVIIYNVVPWSYLSPKLLVRIMREVPGVIGVKQSACDMKTLADLLLLNERGVILSAVDALLYPSFQLGAHGAVAAIVTAAPEWCVALDLHQGLLRLWNAIDAPNLPANVKAAMRLQGREGGVPRAPMPPASAAQIEAIGQALRVAQAHTPL